MVYSLISIAKVAKIPYMKIYSKCTALNNNNPSINARYLIHVVNIDQISSSESKSFQ